MERKWIWEMILSNWWYEIQTKEKESIWVWYLLSDRVISFFVCQIILFGSSDKNLYILHDEYSIMFQF